MEVVVSQSLKGARAVVLGAGPAGLAAALGLAVRGARVRVLDAHPDVESIDGGPRPVEAGGCAFPRGEVDVLMPNLVGAAFALADLRLSDFVRFEARDPALRVWNGAAGNYLDAVRSRQDLSVAVGGMNNAVSARFADFARSAEGAGRALEEGWLAAGPFPWYGGGVRRWRAAVAAMRPRGAEALVARQCPDPAVRALWRALAWRLGVCPFRSSAGVRGHAAVALFRGAWRPDGGMAMLRGALRRVAEMKGVRVVAGARVRRIEFDGTAVRRVVGDGFRPLRADIVVSSLGVGATASEVLADGHVRRWLEARGRLDPGMALRLYLGLSGGRTPADAAGVWIPSADPWEAHRQRDRWRVPPVDPEFLVERVDGAAGGSAPAAGCALRVTIPQPPATERWRWTERNVEGVREVVVGKMEAAGFDGLAGRVAVSHVELPGAPAPAGNRAPGRWSWARQPGPRVRGARGLYLAGPGTHPGPGLSFEVLSGLLAAEAAGRAGA